jgi:predicted transcriptional regulator
MTGNVISVQSDDQVLKAARLVLQSRISGLPVFDKDRMRCSEGEARPG